MIKRLRKKAQVEEFYDDLITLVILLLVLVVVLFVSSSADREKEELFTSSKDMYECHKTMVEILRGASKDPTIKGTAGYYLYDDEGIKARKRRLIHKGHYKELLQNRETAVKFKIKSNGAARASSYDREPLIRMANTFLEKGSSSKNEILKETKKASLFCPGLQG